MTERARRARRTSNAKWLPASGLTLLATTLCSAAPPPTLPVPCIAGACGPSVTSFSGGGATATQAGNQLTVNQTANNALLNWQSFNIGQGSGVKFVQPSATSVAVNEIYQNSPSQIFGSLTANGRIYLINQNGILFGAGAQVNVAGLVASSLNITPNALANGIAPSVTGDPTSPSFQAVPGVTSGAVTVAQGAALNAPGGQIFLFAPQVANQGTITTPDGQTILAAGSAVYLAASQDPNVRGLIVAVDTGGTVTNGTAANSSVTDPSKLVGQIVAQRGNVTLMGLAVNQDGLVSANTSVRANGSILLVAADRSKGGTLNLGANSLTEAPLDATDTSVAVDATLQQKSTVSLRGFDVNVAGGASVVATSGSITATGSAGGAQGSTDLPPTPSGSTSDNSRVYIADGATLDVSGATAVLPMSSNVLQVQLRGSELADDPDQRNGALRGQTVNVDVRQHGTLPDGTPWVGTPLADLSADVATIQRGVFERNETGGTVTLQSSGDVIAGPQAKVNVSGGASNYQSGFLNTSSVIGTNGQLYNIANASPNVLYTGVANSSSYTVTDARWGVTTVYTGIFGNQGQYVPGYVQGADAGGLAINAPHVIFDGGLVGTVQIGPFQRNPATVLPAGQLERFYDQVPLPAALTVGPAASLPNPFTPPDLIVSSINFGPGPVLPTLKNPDGSPFAPLTDAFPTTQIGVTLNPALIGVNAGGRVDLQANGTIDIPAGVDLRLPIGGSFSALASTVDVAGSITGPGASISLQSVPTLIDATSTGVILEPTAVLNAAGAWVNDNPAITPAPATAPLAINGGVISISARDGNVVLAPGALLDVSSGAQLTSGGTFLPGSAGKISIASSSPDFSVPTELSLGATLRGFGFQNGGTLSISASAFCITSDAACTASVPGEISLVPGFFSSGGFANYALDANFGTFELTPGVLQPVQKNFLADTALSSQPSAASVFPLVSIGELPAIQRSPVNLSFSSEYVPPFGTDATPETFATAPNLVLDAGSSIVLDPLARLTLTSNTRILDDALIRSPGGAVSMTVTAGLAEPQFIAGHQIWLGPHAVIDVSGTVIAVTDDRGNNTGNVLAGGTVQLNAQRGAVELQPGSLINVSGSAATLDIPEVDSAGVASFRSTNVASAGGSVEVTAAEAALLSGDMLAASGDPAQIPSGSFSLTLNGNNRYGPDVFGGVAPPYPYDPRTIVIAASQPAIAVAAGLDLPLSLEGKGLVSAQALTKAGFDAVSLAATSLDGATDNSPAVPGIVQFDGNVSLALARSLVLDAAGFSSDGGKATLSAPYVALGQSTFNTQSLLGATSAGKGTLQVNGAMIDLIGHSAFGNFATVTLNSSGDIRANGIQAPISAGEPLDPQLPGALSVSGSLTLIAQQVYPSTLSSFAISAGAGGSGNIDIEAAAGTAPSSLLSAGGTLTLSANQINQAGTVRAPLGSIVMNADSITLAPGSVTSTSADGQLIPFGTTQLGGVDWFYPLGGTSGIIYGADGIPLPTQSIQLSGASVNIAKGSIVDLKGGGDLLAAEFVPGPTGTADVLGASAGAFAILPTSGLTFAPVDPYYSSGSGVAPGQSVYLSGGGGVPAGTYAVLPARYALLPGAYYVTPVSGYQDLSIGQRIPQVDGSVIVAGYSVASATNLGSARTSGFDIQPGTAVQNLAQYTLSEANAFFSSQAASAGVNPQRLPQDAGTLALNATTQLALAGTLQAAPGAGGRGADVDISSASIRIVDASSAPAAIPGVLDLDANSLNSLGVESILLGGTRVETSKGLQITTETSNIEVASGANLKAPELLLAATNAVTLDNGATIAAGGSIPTPDTALLLTGDGALLRVASSGNPLVTRTDSPGVQGQISILPGAVINAPAGAATIDVATSATFGGTLNLSGGSLAISGAQISLGNVPSGTSGVVFPSAVLAGSSIADLSLTGRNSIDFYDGANLSVTNLTLSTGALRGFGTGNSQFSAADTLTLSGAANPSPLAGTGTGTGALALQAGTVAMQAGSLDFSGFSSSTLTSQGVMSLGGTGALTAGGTLNLQAGLLTAESGAQWQISSLGAFTFSAPAASAAIKPPVQAPLGANVAISAASIAFNGAAQLHSGTLSLTATGPTADVALGSAADIDVSGIATVFDSVSVNSRAGTVNLQSLSGSVTAAAGSKINVASLDDSVANAGSLNVQATQGAIDLGGTLLGRDAAVSADALSLGNLTALEAALAGGSFSGDWNLRLRGAGDVTVGAGIAISARSVSLTADQGSIDVEGSIAASSHAGGSIGLWAQGNVTINGTLDARPRASGDANGQIVLSTSQGGVLVGSGATIEAYDGATPVQSLADGGLSIRAPQSSLETLLSGSGAPGLVLAGNLQGLRSITVEGFHTESPSTPGTLGDADVLADMSNPIYADAATFMATAPALLSALGTVKGPTPQIVPGIEIDSSQSLTLASAWTLDQWRFNGAPGVLTLRSAGDLTFAASLTDGFTGTDNVLTSTSPSWSYRLVAGADLNSSNAMAVQPLSVIANSTDGTGSLTVAGGTPSSRTRPAVTTAIRTGTGSIDIAAATDVTLTNMDSVIYTAGIAGQGIAYTGRGQLQGLLYPTEGGDIRISAGRDVVGAPTDDLVTNWLWRVGSPNSKPSPTSTAWTVNFGFFEQGVGALGGGNLSVTAGRDINDLSASVPTVGQQVGSAAPGGSDVRIINTGDITLRAGNNVAGGTVYEGAGSAVVVAGNQITQSATVSGLYPMVLLGDATVTLSAGSGATLAGVANPTLLPQGVAQSANTGANFSYFSTYGANSSVTLQTVAGTAELVNDISPNGALVTQYSTLAFASSGNNNDQSGFSALRIYPGTLSVQSMRGGANVDDTLTLYPEANGNLSLLAYTNINLGSAASAAGSFEIIESNADTSLLPTVANPQGTYQSVSDQLNSIINVDTLFSFLPPNAPTPVHLGGSTPDSTVSRIVALTGDVSAQTSQPSQITFAAPARIIAGRDVDNLVVDFTNLESQDISAVVAGRDISYSFPRSFSGQIFSTPSYIDVDGPGTLEIMAGRSVNLGTSSGVTSRGNLVDTGLPNGGANVTVESGVGDPSTLNYSAFITDYLVNSSAYASNLVAFMQPMLGGSPSQAQALSAFESLPSIEQAPLIDQIFFNELLQSGTNAANPGALHNNFTQGFTAINALFPGGAPNLAQNQTNPYTGDISLYFSRVYTLDGGNVNFLAPGGLINVGLATLPATFGITKSPSDLGVVAQSTGSINSYSYGDFEVNESRVFAADGGNITIWSTQGNIDAGRGSKTAISAPAPIITFVNGVPTVTFPAALTGSGIQALTTSEGVPPGNVGLFAPNGVVNANDAGIVAGNLTIAATAVLGASNIKVSGVSVGVPVEVTGLGASLAGISSAGSSATQAAAENAAANANRAATAAPVAEAALSWLDVFVEGFGAETCKPDDVECLKRQPIR